MFLLALACCCWRECRALLSRTASGASYGRFVVESTSNTLAATGLARIPPPPCQTSEVCFVTGGGGISTHRRGFTSTNALDVNWRVKTQGGHRVVSDTCCERRGGGILMGTTRAKRGATGRPASRNGVGKKVRRILDPASPAEVRSLLLYLLMVCTTVVYVRRCTLSLVAVCLYRYCPV